jgi:hypothetical protein
MSRKRKLQMNVLFERNFKFGELWGSIPMATCEMKTISDRINQPDN